MFNGVLQRESGKKGIYYGYSMGVYRMMIYFFSVVLYRTILGIEYKISMEPIERVWIRIFLCECLTDGYPLYLGTIVLVFVDTKQFNLGESHAMNDSSRTSTIDLIDFNGCCSGIGHVVPDIVFYDILLVHSMSFKCFTDPPMGRPVHHKISIDRK